MKLEITNNQLLEMAFKEKNVNLSSVIGNSLKEFIKKNKNILKK